MGSNGAPGSRTPVLAICGGGNAGHALAIVTSQNFDGDVVWLAGSPEKADLLRRCVFSEDGLKSTGAIVGKAHRVRMISSYAADVIPDADIVLIAVPAFAHAIILKQIEPFLKPTALVGSLPTRSGFEFEATHLLSGIEPGGRRIFGLQTLPWSTRVQETGKVVNFGCSKSKVLMAAMPRRDANDLAQQLTQLFGIEIVPTNNFLNMTLGNPGQLIHPGLMYGLFAEWAGEPYSADTVPLFYKHASDATGEFISRLSSEIQHLAQEIQTRSDNKVDLSGVMSIHEWLCVSYPTQTADLSTVATSFRTGPLQHRKAPMLQPSDGVFSPDFEYRYLSEDVPYGIVVTKAIAQLADVPTPGIDTLLSWAQTKLGKRYLVQDKLEGPDIAGLPIPQNYGIHNLNELISWYAQDRAPAATRSIVA